MSLSDLLWTRVSFNILFYSHNVYGWSDVQEMIKNDTLIQNKVLISNNNHPTTPVVHPSFNDL